MPRALRGPSAAEVAAAATHGTAAFAGNESTADQQGLSHRIVKGNFIGVDSDSCTPVTRAAGSAHRTAVQVGKADRSAEGQFLFNHGPRCPLSETHPQAQLPKRLDLGADAGGVAVLPSNQVVGVICRDLAPEGCDHRSRTAGTLPVALARLVVGLAEVGNGE